MEPRYDLLVMGRALMDLYANEAGVPFAAVRSFAVYVGGCPANISVGAARLGLRTALLTATGDDAAGGFVREFLGRESVDVSFAPTKAGRRTSAVLLAVEAPDRPCLVAYRDNCADLELTVEDVRAAPIEACRALLITGTGLSREPSRSATLFAAARARAAGVRVFLDLDYRDECWPGAGEFRMAVTPALPLVDVAIGTAEEIGAALHGSYAPSGPPGEIADPAGTLLAPGPEALVMKRGPEGTRVFPRDGAPFEAPTFQVEVRNPLGAGDAFAAGLIYGRLRGWDWPRAARFGNACGALVVTRHGCANFMPREQEVAEFMGSRMRD